jgi:hypothetical protein
MKMHFSQEHFGCGLFRKRALKAFRIFVFDFYSFPKDKHQQ